MSIKSRFPTSIDYDRDFAHALYANGYKTFASPIILRQVTVQEKGIKNITVDVFMHQTQTGSMGALWSMSSHLRRPLDALELLSFGEAHPDVQLLMPIIALGTIITLGDTTYVLGLTRDGEERALRLFPYATEWPVEYGFLGTKK